MMTDIEEMAKACFDRQEWERHEDRPSHIIEKWDDIDDTAKEYWREFVKPLLSFLRAAELRGRVAGMDVAKVSRVEVIDYTLENGGGRVYVKYSSAPMRAFLQDDDRTLKIFIGGDFSKLSPTT